LENSPSNVAAIDQLLRHFISTDAVVNTESDACAALFTTKLAPGNVWNVAPIARLGSGLALDDEM
jgi:hypothetical protein